MMKWRVQKKQPRKKEEQEGRLVISAPDASPEEVKASLDYLDSVIEEYNCIGTPSPTPVTNGTGNGCDATSSPSPTIECEALQRSPSPARRAPSEEGTDNVSLIVIRDVITTRLSPPPVPRRGPRSCCRNREYPVSPPPRRRYTSPERRVKEQRLRNNAKSQDTSVKRNPSSPAFNPAYQRYDPNNNVTTKMTDVTSTAPKGDNHHRVTVTFRTVTKSDTPPPLPPTSPPSSPVTPPCGTFRRKIESRNSIHVDFNVKDACGQNSSWPGSDFRGKTAEEGKFCRTRSLRGLRRAVDDEAVRGTSASPPPLPPRKSRDDGKRGVQFAKHVTFYVNDGGVLNGRKEDAVSRVTTMPGSPILRVKTPVQHDLDLGPQDGTEPVQDRVFIKTFEPSAVDDVPTDCYNVYNVRTGKISSSVHEPPLVGRRPLKSVGSNGNALERLRSISPTREAAEKFIGKIISKCKSTAGGNKDKKMATERQPRLTKQQRHSRCTKCAVALGK